MGGNGFGGVGVVSSQHDRLDAQVMQFGNGLPAADFDRIGHSKHAVHFMLISQKNDRLALLFQGRQTGFQCVGAATLLVDQAVIAQIEGLSVDDALGATSRQGFKCINIAQGNVVALSGLGDRFGHWVIRATGQAGCQTAQLGLIHPTEHHKVRLRRLTVRDGSSLVER